MGWVTNGEHAVLATAEDRVAALQQRYVADVKARLRDSIAGASSGFLDLLRYHLGWLDVSGEPALDDGGKSLRSVLCLATCEMLGGDWRQALSPATAVDLIHNFSLIHDDIQDGDVTRRGRPTLWQLKGVDQAAAAGNAMRTIADQALSASAALSPEVLLAASIELTHRHLEMIEGQFLDLAYEHTPTVTTTQYLDMISRKTGALVQGAMFLGAMIATQDEKLSQRLGDCGRRLGIAFQVRDDYLGIWGNPQATGKAVGADIKRKKKSLPIVFMMQQASPTQRRWIDKAYQEKEVAPENVERVLALLDELNAKAYVDATANEAAQGALEVAQSLELGAEALRDIEAVARFFTTRHK